MPGIESSLVRSPIYSPKEYLFATMSADQNSGLSAGSPVRINTNSASSGSISIDPGTYRITLPAYGTYRVTVNIKANFGAVNGYLEAGIYNVTSSIYLVPCFMTILPMPYSAANDASTPVTQALITTGSSAVVIEIRIASISTVSNIQQRNTSVIVEKMEATIPITYGSVFWDDLRFPAQGVYPPGLASDPTWDATNIGWSFSPTVTNILQMVCQLPHSYKEGTSIYPHVHWEPSNTDTGNTLWRLGYRWRNNGETAAALTTQDILVPAGGTALTLQIDSFAALTKANATISSILDIELSRIGGDGTDTFTGNAILKEFDIHFMKDTDGSLNEWIK